jgi:hypothetical protein
MAAHSRRLKLFERGVKCDGDFCLFLTAICFDVVAHDDYLSLSDLLVKT